MYYGRDGGGIFVFIFFVLRDYLYDDFVFICC